MVECLAKCRPSGAKIRTGAYQFEFAVDRMALVLAVAYQYCTTSAGFLDNGLRESE